MQKTPTNSIAASEHFPPDLPPAQKVKKYKSALLKSRKSLKLCTMVELLLSGFFFLVPPCLLGARYAKEDIDSLTLDAGITISCLLGGLSIASFECAKVPLRKEFSTLTDEFLLSLEQDFSIPPQKQKDDENC